MTTEAAKLLGECFPSLTIEEISIANIGTKIKDFEDHESFFGLLVSEKNRNTIFDGDIENMNEESSTGVAA
jgi:hypothetical protein